MSRNERSAALVGTDNDEFGVPADCVGLFGRDGVDAALGMFRVHYLHRQEQKPGSVWEAGQWLSGIKLACKQALRAVRMAKESTIFCVWVEDETKRVVYEWRNDGDTGEGWCAVNLLGEYAAK